MPVINKELKKEVKNVSKALGISEQETLKRALLFYSDRVRKISGLKNEFEEWDKLSDEALINFEKSLS